MKQPHEGIVGADRTGDPLVSLEDEHLPIREALTVMARHLSTATLVGNPAPVVERMGARIRTPQIGDLVIESSRVATRRGDWYRGFGYLVERRREWWDTDAEYERMVADEEIGAGEPRSVDEAWYIQYGPNPADVCRWTDCSFLVIPIAAEVFALPAGHRDGSGVTFTRESLLAGLADSGFTLRTPPA